MARSGYQAKARKLRTRYTQSLTTYKSLRVSCYQDRTLDTTAVSKEFRMHELIHEAQVDVESNRHIVALLDSFEHVGPNGTQQCLIFEPRGPDIGVALEDTAKTDGIYTRGKSVAKQVLLGSRCVHICQIAHWATNPSNLLLALKQLTSRSTEKLAQDRFPDNVSPPFKREDGKSLYVGIPVISDKGEDHATGSCSCVDAAYRKNRRHETKCGASLSLVALNGGRG